MARALLVSNGHGEASIADRIADELRALDPQLELEHLGLVGEHLATTVANVGPQRALPSGGLIAMGNVRNIARDVRGGLLSLTVAQYRFLLASRKRYDVVVAIGDVYALLMARAAGAPAVFVGTAKSVNFAPYGPWEERVLRGAAARFVRDDATAQRLREHGLDVEPAANVIVDLFATGDDPRAQRAVEGFDPAIALFPGSREDAYDDAAFLLEVVAALLPAFPRAGAVLSIARGLDADGMLQRARRDGWEAHENAGDALQPFVLALGGRDAVRTWRGPIGPLLARVGLVLGQAGTANEAAAAAGVPVVAFERGDDRKALWYRKRQRGLLGDAMTVLPRDAGPAAAGVRALLEDDARRDAMGAAGRARMGAPGAARRIAQRIVELVRERD
ncbi:MAG: hypothetical protein JO199_01590 [Candidatus Eremiobacteraeota bacterium]|nr:hypothetical protein [Candidatus Eremiobacteraeota bacterium]